jgi:putative sigma-54 modulation protein
MELDLTGIHIEVTDSIKEFVEKKIQKLEKFFEPETICHVTFSAPVKGKQDVDMRIEYKSRTYLAETKSDDLYYAIEELISKIEGQIRKDKSVFEKKRKETLAQESNNEDIEEMLD